MSNRCIVAEQLGMYKGAYLRFTSTEFAVHTGTGRGLITGGGGGRLRGRSSPFSDVQLTSPGLGGRAPPCIGTGANLTGGCTDDGRGGFMSGVRRANVSPASGGTFAGTAATVATLLTGV